MEFPNIFSGDLELLEYLKNAVSIPNVSTTAAKALTAYTSVITP